MGYAVIFGGGEFGRRFIEKLLENDWRVTVLDEDPEVCKEIVEKYGIRAINGDGTDPEVLDEAEISEADIYILATPNEEKNILSSFLAREKKVNRIVIRLSIPKYIKLIKNLGMEYIFYDKIIDYFSYTVIFPNVLNIYKYTDFYILEVKVDDRLGIIGKKIEDIEKEETKVLYYRFNNELKEPSKDDVVREGMILYIVSKEDPKKFLKKWMI
ncbi:TrkA family potassium uptake protein [Nanoarchaeota archaeon NZ13-N]|nr:MAG: TrkA family potassium uptake protein [Nanoarchaeota archaeon NZ13-N]